MAARSNAVTGCQHDVSCAPCAGLPLRNMIAWDWYDGPETGILTCEECQAEFYFFMIDWSRDHDKRVFAVQELERGAVASLIGLVGEAREFPIWYPDKLKCPIESDRPWIEQLDTLVLSSRQVTSKVVAWDNRRHLPIAISQLPHDKLCFTEQLLESDFAFCPFNWLAFLGLSRD